MPADIPAADPMGAEIALVGSRTWVGLGVVLIGAFVATLDTFIVNVAVPSLRADLHASYADAELVIAGYTLTYAVGQVTGGRLGDNYGRRRLFVVGLGGFTLASGLCAIAPDPAVLGQILGGLVVEANLWGLAWRPVFLINLPIGLGAVIAAPFVVPESRGERASRLDRSGVALSTVGLSLLVFPLIEGQPDGWPAWSLAMLGVSVVVLAAFVADQARKSARNRAPLLDMSLFTGRSFSIGAAAVLAFSATMPPLYLAFTVLVQAGYGASPLTAALDFAPLALAFSVASFAAGRLTRHGGRPVLVITGAGLNVVGACVAVVSCLAGPGDVPAALIPALVLTGTGEGLFLTPVFNVVLSGVADRHAGTASGALSTMQRLGNALGIAVLEIPFLLAYHDLRAGGASLPSAYTRAFAAISGAVAITCAVVAGLLLLLPAGSAEPDPPG